MTHLTDEQFANLLTGEPDADAAAHLAACAQCRAELEATNSAAAGLRTYLSAATDRPRTISLAAPRQRRWFMLPGTAALAVALVIGGTTLALHHRHHPPHQLVHQKPIPARPEISDNALLAAINNDISDSTPDALAPASVIKPSSTQSQPRSSATQSTSNHQEAHQ